MKPIAKGPDKIVAIMVDGFGVPPEGWDTSVFHKLAGSEFAALFRDSSVPIDATLGVAGLPQSATGQTALFTGVNAPELLGRHLPGFPNNRLADVIRSKNIFSDLLDRGLSVCFANAYVRHGLRELKILGCCSVTTVMTESALKTVRGLRELLDGDAVYHDLTQETLAPDFDVPRLTPLQSAQNLLALSRGHNLTLFEYFLTDRAGHKSDTDALKKHLAEFAEFLLSLKESLPPDTALVLSSDHGNCEDLSTKNHTLNPVPLLLINFPAPRDAKRITDIPSLILSTLA